MSFQIHLLNAETHEIHSIWYIKDSKLFSLPLCVCMHVFRPFTHMQNVKFTMHENRFRKLMIEMFSSSLMRKWIEYLSRGNKREMKSIRIRDIRCSATETNTDVYTHWASIMLFDLFHLLEYFRQTKKHTHTLIHTKNTHAFTLHITHIRFHLIMRIASACMCVCCIVYAYCFLYKMRISVCSSRMLNEFECLREMYAWTKHNFW